MQLKIIDHKTNCNGRTLSFENIPKAIIMNQKEGLIKIASF